MAGPLIWGFVLAYLLSPTVMRIERLLGRALERKKERATLKRALSLVIVYLLLLCVLVIVVRLVLPELVKSIFALIDVLPTYARYLAGQITRLMEKNGIDNEQVSEALGTG